MSLKFSEILEFFEFCKFCTECWFVKYSCSNTSRLTEPSTLLNIFEKLEVFNLYKFLLEGLRDDNSKSRSSVCIPGCFFGGWNLSDVKIL